MLTFLGAPDVLGLARISANDEKRPQGEVLLEITARWLTLVALIAAVVYLAGVGPTLDYGLLTTWFALTPVGAVRRPVGRAPVAHAFVAQPRVRSAP